jgi:hypothetical protein
MPLDLATHHALDVQLLDLRPRLGGDKTYSEVACFTAKILDSMTAGDNDGPKNKLLQPRWEEVWDRSEMLHWGWFLRVEDPDCHFDEPVNEPFNSLHQAFTEMARFARSASTVYHEQKYRGQLLDALSDYLWRRGRGLPVQGSSSDQPTDGDEFLVSYRDLHAITFRRAPINTIRDHLRKKGLKPHVKGSRGVHLFQYSDVAEVWSIERLREPLPAEDEARERLRAETQVSNS